MPLVAASLRCVATLAIAVAILPQSAFAASNCTEDNVVTGNYRSSAWKLNFTSSSYICRYYSGDLDYLYNDVKQTASNQGSDAGAGKNVSEGKLVDSIAVTQYCKATIGSSVNTSGGGYWWTGPKTIISSTKYYSGLDNNYECYIVEYSNLSPTDLANKVVYWTTTGKYRSEATFDGSVYKTYTNKLGKINQVWTIRQNYRSTGGWTSVGYIQKDWRTIKSGQTQAVVPSNWYNLGWKYNVEFSGVLNGYVQFSYFDMPWN